MPVLQTGRARPSYGPDTALLIVDMQNDFVSPGGSLPVRDGESLVPVLAREIARARSRGALVAYSQDWHPPHTSHFAQEGGLWPVHCVQNSWGAQLHPRLPVEGPVIRKGTRRGEDGYSAFRQRRLSDGGEEDTGLEALLLRNGIRRLVVTGVATEYCVQETARDGVRRGFETWVLADAVRPVEAQQGDGERALQAMWAMGVSVEAGAPSGSAPEHAPEPPARGGHAPWSG